ERVHHYSPWCCSSCCLWFIIGILLGAVVLATILALWITSNSDKINATDGSASIIVSTLSKFQSLNLT
ncbi:unnamed protein product, partial [Rotaria sp. Silwood1]